MPNYLDYTTNYSMCLFACMYVYIQCSYTWILFYLMQGIRSC